MRSQVAAALGVVLGLDLLEHDAGQLAVVVSEFLRHEVVEDRDILVHGVLLFPGGRLHLLEAGAHDNLHVLAAEAARRTAAIHRGVAAAEHDDALADRGGVAERHRRKPVDADVDVLRRFLAAGDLELAAARRAGADEHRVVAFGEQRFQAVDAFAADEPDAHVEDVVALLVDDAVGQAEFWNLRAHHAAGLRILIEHGQVVAERREIARHGERSGTAADQRDALAVLQARRLRHAAGDVVLVIGGDALEAADCDGIFFDAAAAACGLARAVAGASENPRKHVGLPIDHVGVAVAAFGDQSDVFRDRRVCRTGPLAVDDFVKVVRCRDIGRFHLLLHLRASPRNSVEWRSHSLCDFIPGGPACFVADSGTDVSLDRFRLPPARDRIGSIVNAREAAKAMLWQSGASVALGYCAAQ
jgi:hypothetical protein